MDSRVGRDGWTPAAADWDHCWADKSGVVAGSVDGVADSVADTKTGA